MAASATRHPNHFVIHGAGGLRMDTGTITFDSDATVEVNTPLTRIVAWSFAPAGSGGNAAMLSLDETVSNGEVAVAAGAVTVDATGNTTDTWKYVFWGY